MSFQNVFCSHVFRVRPSPSSSSRTQHERLRRRKRKKQWIGESQNCGKSHFSPLPSSHKNFVKKKPPFFGLPLAGAHAVPRIIRFAPLCPRFMQPQHQFLHTKNLNSRFGKTDNLGLKCLRLIFNRRGQKLGIWSGHPKIRCV